jgi:hypothetical protein
MQELILRRVPRLRFWILSLLQSAVTRAGGEKIIVRLDIFGQIHGLAGFKLSYTVQDDWITVMVGALEMAGEPSKADVFVSLSCVVRGDLVLRKDGLIRAFRDAGAAINASVRVNVEPGPFIDWFSRYDAFYWTNIDTSRVT